VKVFKAFYIQHKSSLFAYLMRMSADYDLAWDILQESFTRLLDRYPSRVWSKALLFKIARNTFIDEKRKSRHRKSQELTEYHGARNYEQDFFVREKYRAVLRSLQQLDSMERDILSLRISSNLTYRDIADIVGISEANVKVKVHRARIKLKSLL